MKEHEFQNLLANRQVHHVVRYSALQDRSASIPSFVNIFVQIQLAVVVYACPLRMLEIIKPGARFVKRSLLYSRAVFSPLVASVLSAGYDAF